MALEPVLQPLYNLAEDEFFGYDIALSDDTTIQVLKEDGRAPSSKSALWIRRGGPPDKPVVLVDYRQSKSAQTAYGLLSEFKGYLVCDAAPSFNQSARQNQLTLVHCNDYGVSRKGTRTQRESCLLYTSPSPRDATLSRMPSSA